MNKSNLAVDIKTNLLEDLKRHAPFWILIYFVWTYIKSDGEDIEVFLIINLFNILCYTIAYYSLVNVYIPTFFSYGRYFLFALSLLLTSFLLLLFMYINDVLWFSDFGGWEVEPISGEFYLRKAIQYYSPGMILLAWESKMETDKEHKRIQALEKEKLTTELKYLRSQLNPHFLFNALNNIYSMAIKNEQKEIATGLENLSGIMRYLTYESSDKEVPLIKEIVLLKNFIEVAQLRAGGVNDSIISFNVKGETNGLMIAPVILLPLVENAIKHGLKEGENCLVSIKIIIEDHHFHIYIKNTLFSNNHETIDATGVGLDNVKRRLKLRYPSLHSFEVNVDEKYFYTSLELNLGE